jgi:sugar phosphate isomerase/epimerase
MRVIIIFSGAFLIGMAGFLTSCNRGTATDQTTTAGDSSSAQTSLAVQYPEEELGWKLGAHAYTFRLFTFFEAVDKIDSCGLKYVEGFSGQQIGGGIDGKMDYKMDDATRQKILAKLREKGITLYAYGVVNPDNEADWKTLFEFGKAMGIHTFTSEPAEKFLPLVSNLCDKYEINVAIHNHPTPKHYWNPDVVLAAIKGRSPRLGACADIGHWVRSDLDPVECLKKLEGHVLHLHMKDLNYKEGKDEGAEDRDVVWGTGVAKTDGVIAELKRQHFKGMISAEYERHWENNAPLVKESVDYFRKAL